MHARQDKSGEIGKFLPPLLKKIPKNGRTRSANSSQSQTFIHIFHNNL